MVFSFLSGFLGLNGLANSYLIKVIIDGLESSSEHIFLPKTLLWGLILIVANYEVNNFSWRGVNYILLKILPQIKTQLVNILFKHIHFQEMSFFHNNQTGKIHNSVHMIVSEVERILSVIFPRVIRGASHIIIAIISLFFINKLFAFSLFIWMVLFTISSVLFTPKISLLSDKYARSLANVYGWLFDTLNNALNIRIFSKRKNEQVLLNKLLSRMNSQFKKKEKFLIKLHLFQGISVTVLISIIAYLLAFLWYRQLISVGDLVFVLGSTLYITENVRDFTEQIDRLGDSVGNCRNSLNILYTGKTSRLVNEQNKRITDGKIAFQGVYFRYDNRDPLLEDVTFTIEPRQKIGIVGPSGSGKSTIINLLARLYRPDQGRILIDDIDISSITDQSLYRAFSIIPQDLVLFNRSIYENVAYGCSYTSKTEVFDAMKAVQLHDFIKALPQGYDTQVGEKGIKFSGGQKQRIALARVLIKNAPIVLMDEPTSQVDSFTEKEIKTALDSVLKNKTTVIISHHFSILEGVDRVFLVDAAGVILEKDREWLGDKSLKNWVGKN